MQIRRHRIEDILGPTGSWTVEHESDMFQWTGQQVVYLDVYTGESEQSWRYQNRGRGAAGIILYCKKGRIIAIGRRSTDNNGSVTDSFISGP